MMKRFAIPVLIVCTLLALFVFAEVGSVDPLIIDKDIQVVEKMGRYPLPEKDLPLSDKSLQQIIDEARPGSVVKIPLAQYVLIKPLKITDKKQVHFAFAPGSQVRGLDPHRDVITIEKCENIKITGMRARHVAPLKAYECHGSVVTILDSKAIHIDNCELNGCGAIGVNAQESHITITNCHIHSNSLFAFVFYDTKAKVASNIIEKNDGMLQAYNCKFMDFRNNLIRENGSDWKRKIKPGLVGDSEPADEPIRDKP